MNTNFLDSLTNFIKKRTFELLGLILILTSLALALSFATYTPEDPSFIYGDSSIEIKNFFGIYGSTTADFLLQSFGLASFLLLINFLSWGFNLLIKKEIKGILLKLFFVTAHLTLGSIFIYLTFNNSFWLIDNGNSGFVGEISYNFISNLTPWVNNKYFIFIIFFLTIVFFIFSSGLNMKNITVNIFKVILSIFRKKEKINTSLNFSNNEIVEEEVLIKKPQQSFLFENTEKEVKENILKKNKYRLPSIDFLEKGISKPSLLDVNKNRPNEEFMEKILLDFGIDGKIKTINNGPVVSLYEFEPAPGVKVSKIINLSEDLARNTSSTSARVSVIPGKNTVGIEIPNESRESVSLREIIDNDKFQKKEIKLPIALGKSISGIPIVGDLTSMPHLLIAGTTGSGKSVCINTIIVSLLYKLNPDLCKFILIDPKMLELSTYEGIPHLLTPVITDAKKATSAYRIIF